MEDANDPSSKNNHSVIGEDQHYNDALQTHLETFLPFINQVIDNSKRLNIQSHNASKLTHFYNILNKKRLQPALHNNCNNVLYGLYNSYVDKLNYYLPPDFKTSWMQENKLNDEQKNLSSDVKCKSYKGNQNQNSESTLSNKIPVPGTSYESIANNQEACLEVLSPNIENAIDKTFENVKNIEEFYRKNAINNSMLTKNYLTESLDIHLRLNTSIPHSELTTPIFDGIIKQKNGSNNHENMLKGINLDNININYFKNVMDGIQRPICVEPIQAPPLSSSDLMKTEASRINLISTTQLNFSEVTQDNALLSKSSTIIHAQLNTETNNLQKTGSSNETKPTSLIPNKNNLNVKLFVNTTQKMSVNNSRSSSNHTNIQLLNPQFSLKHNGDSIQFQNKPFPQNQKNYNRINDKKNNYRQFSNYTQMHVNPPYTEPLTRYCDPVPLKFPSNCASKRDPRILKSVKTTQYSDYKKYREAKYKKQSKGYTKHKNQMNQDQDQYRRLANDKIGKKNIIDSSYYSFGSLKETASIKNFKIPKIKHNQTLNDNNTVEDSELKTFGDNKNNTDILKTKINSRLKAGTIKEKHLVDGQKSEQKISNKSIKDPKITDEINDSHTDKALTIEITKNSNTDRGLKMNNEPLNNKSRKDDSCPEIDLEEIIVNIPSEINKDESESIPEQNSILTYRSEPNNSRPKFDKDITVTSCKILKFGECNENLCNVSIPNSNDVSGQIELGHNILLSPSKKQSEVINSTTEISCKSQRENIVSSNKDYSTTDNNPDIKDKNLIEIIKNPNYMNIIRILLQNQDKIEKFNKLLELSDSKIKDNKLKKKDILIKKKKIKRNQRKNKKKVIEKSSNKESKNEISNDNNNQAKNIIKTKKKNSHLNKLNKGTTNSGNIHGHSSTDQHKLKSKKCYGNFKIVETKCYPESKELKMVIAKLDKNIKISENCNSDISSKDKQTDNKLTNVEKSQEIKSKKPFIGPLSVKLARQKMESKQNNSLNEQEIKNQLKFETKKVRKGSTFVDGTAKREKLNSKTLTRLVTEQPIILTCPFQNPKLFDDKTNNNKSVEQNSNTSTFIVDKPKIKRARRSELEKLQADISKMFDCEAVLYASNKRKCRTNKQIDYVNAKKKRMSNIEQLDTNDDQKNFISRVGKPKNTKKNVKKSPIKLNTEKQFDLNVLSNEQKQPDSFFSIKKKCYEQNIDKIEQESVINENSSKLSIYENLPNLTIETNSLNLTINEDTTESNIDENLQESKMLNFLPKQAYQFNTNETEIYTEQLTINFSEYTLKEKSKKIVLAGLSCELMNSFLLFKCSVSNCIEIQFSTVIFIDFSEHINKNHQFVKWDGNCDTCQHKLQPVSKQYYVRNALEHLISHHLILKNNEKHPNTIDSKTENLPSLCQEKKSQRIENWLGVCCLPGDRLSIHKPSSSNISNIYDMSTHKSLSGDTKSINKNDFLENNMFENSEQSSHNILLSNQCQTSVNLNINRGSNDDKFPSFSSLLSDVKSLKKGKVNTSKINSSASYNDNLYVWKKAETKCEVVLSNPEIFLEIGQRIVNNGVSIDGTVYCVIDTAYTKDYIKKLRDFPMNMMKTQSAFNEMSALPRLLGLFKCMGRSCANIFGSKELFKLHLGSHFSNAEKQKKNQICNVQQFKMCAYCFKEFDDEESLANHIAEKYTFCKYFCPHCFYRAYTASHVLVHQSVVHTNISENRIIKLVYDDRAFEYPKEMLLVVDFKEFVLPYKCNVGRCNFFCYLQNEYMEHLSQKHPRCDKFCCYICTNKDNGERGFALHSTLIISHFKIHNLNKYQCIFCLFGNESIDLMIEHLAFEHFEYEPLCLERSTISDNYESKNIRNLKILRLEKIIDIENIEIVNLPMERISIPEVLPQRYNKRTIECPDILTIAMNSACIDEGSQPSDTVINTVPDSAQMAKSSTSMSLAVDNEFIMFDDVNKNDMNKSLKITRVWSEANIKKKEPVSSNNDIIVIDDEDNVVLSEKEELMIDDVNKNDMNKSLKITRVWSEANIKKKEPVSSNNDIIVIDDEDNVVLSEKEELMIDDVNKNDMNKSLKITRVWSEANIKKKEPVSSNNDIIVIDDEDNVVLSEKEELNEDPTKQICLEIKESINRPNNAKRLTFPIIELDKLFVCQKCDKVFTNGDIYVAHLKVCPFWDYMTGEKCMYCGKLYKTPLNMTEHIKLHGPDRFKCYLCDFKVPSLRAIRRHMRISHRIINIDVVPKCPNLTDFSKDDFIVLEDKAVEQNMDCKDNLSKITQEQSIDTNNSVNYLNTQQNTSLKRKRGFENLFFSPDTIYGNPKSKKFPDRIGCLLCKYTTKLRSKLITHLNAHKIRQDNTTKKIVCTSTFDVTNTKKIKRDELDKNIVGVAPDDSLNTKVFPQFISKNMLYKCSVPLCTFTGVTYDMLKEHISIFHPTSQYYICPHCLPRYVLYKFIEQNEIESHLMYHGSNLYRCQYCDYIHFNRVEINTHLRDFHLLKTTRSVQSNIIIIRQMTCKDLHKQSKHLKNMENMLEQLQSSESIEPSPVPSIYGGILTGSIPLKKYRRSRSMSKSSKSATNGQRNMLLTELES